MTQRPRTIVVGYDGSPTARAAFEHAVERAGEGGRLFVVYAYAPPGGLFGGNVFDRVIAEHQAYGREVLAGVPPAPGAEVETELIGDHAAAAIARVAEVREADEIVVGSRGFSPLRSALGSTSHELLHRADRPVTVVPARAAESE